MIVMACVAPVAGRLVDTNGRRSVLAIGLVAVGLGAVIVGFSSSQPRFVVGLSLVSAIAFGAVGAHVVSTGVARLFDESRGLAIGIATSGATAGQFLIVSLIAYLLAPASWRVASSHWPWAVSFSSLFSGGCSTGRQRSVSRPMRKCGLPTSERRSRTW